MNEIIKAESTKELLNTIENFNIIKQEDMKFLIENREHFIKVFNNSYIWRTDNQKRSILSDSFFPTIHGKFHQAIMEQKVQLDQAFYLAKEYEIKKLEIEELEYEIEELEQSTCKKDIISSKKKKIEKKFKMYELEQQQIQMNYRMLEVRGWQKIQEELIEVMKQNGINDEQIWTKEVGEVEEMFFLFLNNLHGIKKTTDGGEYNNLLGLARFAVQQAKDYGIFKNLVSQCNRIQLESLEILGEIKMHNE